MKKFNQNTDFSQKEHIWIDLASISKWIKFNRLVSQNK